MYLHNNIYITLNLAIDHANFFGYIVKQNGYELSDERKSAVNDIPFPLNLQGMQRFLGSSIFFKPFVLDYSGISAPLSDMIKGSFSWNKSTWSKDYEQAFVNLKAALLHSLKIHFPDFIKKFILRTDASKVAMAGVLLQEDPDTGELQPVAFISSKLSETVKRWDAYKLEAYGIYYAVKQLSYFLHGKEFVIETDHQNLQWIEKSESPIVMRWRWFLQNFHILIKHIPCTKNILADYLSRLDITSTTTLLQLLTDLTVRSETILINIHHRRLQVQVEMKKYHDLYAAISEFVYKYMMMYKIPYDGFTFSINGERIKYKDTPQSLGIKHGDTIQVTGEPFVPDHTPTQVTTSDFTQACFLSRGTPEPANKPTLKIQFLDRLKGKAIIHEAQLDTSKSYSTIPSAFYDNYLSTTLYQATSSNLINIPVRIINPTASFNFEANIQFQIVKEDAPITLSYQHINHQLIAQRTVPL